MQEYLVYPDGISLDTSPAKKDNTCMVETEIAAEVIPHSPRPEVLKDHHTYAVLMPYSSNLKQSEPHNEVPNAHVVQRGEPRLSFYSLFALNAAYELFIHGDTDKIILCGESTFGKDKKTTSQLQKEALLRLTQAHPERRQLHATDIITVEAANLNNTAFQLQAIDNYQRKQKLREQQFLILNWEFHGDRINTHIQGFHMNAETASVEELHQYYAPKFQLDTFKKVLPRDFEEGEKELRFIAKLDPKGYIFRLLTLIRGGRVTDIKHTPTGLELDDVTGKQRAQEMRTLTDIANMKSTR